jgi:hypothetical protein
MSVLATDVFTIAV